MAFKVMGMHVSGLAFRQSLSLMERAGVSASQGCIPLPIQPSGYLLGAVCVLKRLLERALAAWPLGKMSCLMSTQIQLGRLVLAQRCVKQCVSLNRLLTNLSRRFFMLKG